MSTINLVVEKVNDTPINNMWEGLYSNFLCKTITCEENKDIGYHWGMANKSLILHFIKSNHITLIEKQDYSGHLNSFYLINIRCNDDLENAAFLNNLSIDTLNFLRRTEMPILLWYPLETTGYLDIIETGIKIKNKLNLKNKVILCTLSSYQDHEGTNIDFKKINTLLENFKIVQSLGFIIHYGSRFIYNQSIAEQFKFTYRSIPNIETLYKFPKKYDFLCLNHIHRDNRSLLLQALYHNKKLWDNNLISVLHNVNDIPNFKSIFIDYINLYTEKESNLISNPNLKFLIESSIKPSQTDFIREKLDKLILSYEGPDLLINFIRELILSSDNFYPKRHLDERTTELNDNFNIEWFQNSVFSLITETYCKQHTIKAELPMITEKTVKAIYNYHPFIIFGHHRTHQLLNSLGFRTYEYLINLPDDSQPGNLTTLEKLYNLIECLKSFDKTKVDYDRLKADAIHNYQHLHNTDWCEEQVKLILSV